MGPARQFGIACGLVLLAAAPGRPAADTPVAIRVFQFGPAALEVPVGTRVQWSNEDEIEHTVTSGDAEHPDGKFGGTLAVRGSTFAFTFTQPGSYHYFCDRHHFMRGEVRVLPGKADH